MRLAQLRAAAAATAARRAASGQRGRGCGAAPPRAACHSSPRAACDAAAPAECAAAAAAPASTYSDDCVSGTLRLRQGTGRHAYRSGLDALLLATDLPPEAQRPGALILELGAAHGVVALSVATRLPQCQVVAVERQASLHALLTHNAAAAGLRPPRFTALAADVRDAAALPRAAAQLVLANPPFFPPQAAMLAPGGASERACARHELHGDVAAFVAAAAAALAPRGALKVVLPPSRLAALLAALEAASPPLRLRSLRFVHPAPGEGAYLFEAVAARGGPGGAELAVRPPLCVRGRDGRYTLEAATRIAGAALRDGAPPSAAAVAAVRATCVRPASAAADADDADDDAMH